MELETRWVQGVDKKQKGWIKKKRNRNYYTIHLPRSKKFLLMNFARLLLDVGRSS